jgi:hypothetical protein
MRKSRPLSKLDEVGMLTVDQQLAKIDSEIAAATALARKQSDRLKIIRSYKGDTSKCAAAIKTTKQKLVSLQAERRQLLELTQGLSDRVSAP